MRLLKIDHEWGLLEVSLKKLLKSSITEKVYLMCPIKRVILRFFELFNKRRSFEVLYEITIFLRFPSEEEEALLISSIEEEGLLRSYIEKKEVSRSFQWMTASWGLYRKNILKSPITDEVLLIAYKTSHFEAIHRRRCWDLLWKENISWGPLQKTGSWALLQRT